MFGVECSEFAMDESGNRCGARVAELVVMTELEAPEGANDGVGGGGKAAQMDQTREGSAEPAEGESLPGKE